jgi:organic radical activating enzyme
MKKNELIVSEVFYSLQCEGREIGRPAVFLRLAGCNLLCKSATWVCDTIEVWQKGISTPFEDVIKPEWIQRLKDGAHLVITGGEPLLHQQNVSDYISHILRTYKFLPFIEIETNGTVLPIMALQNCVKFWNVSPKLSNCGEPFEKRVNEVAIQYFNSIKGTVFKFVISRYSDLLELWDTYDVFKSKVMLMPAGDTRDELNAVRMDVVKMCIEYGYRYSERLHIVIWDKKTGV